MTHAGFYVTAHRKGSEQTPEISRFPFFPASEHAAGGDQSRVMICNLMHLRQRHPAKLGNFFEQIFFFFKKKRKLKRQKTKKKKIKRKKQREGNQTILLGEYRMFMFTC